MRQETIDHMNSLPKPDDQDGWRKRALEIFGTGFDINRIPPLAPGEIQLSPEQMQQGDECEVRR